MVLVHQFYSCFLGIWVYVWAWASDTLECKLLHCGAHLSWPPLNTILDINSVTNSWMNTGIAVSARIQIHARLGQEQLATEIFSQHWEAFTAFLNTRTTHNAKDFFLLYFEHKNIPSHLFLTISGVQHPKLPSFLSLPPSFPTTLHTTFACLDH